MKFFVVHWRSAKELLWMHSVLNPSKQAKGNSLIPVTERFTLFRKDMRQYCKYASQTWCDDYRRTGRVSDMCNKGKSQILLYKNRAGVALNALSDKSSNIMFRSVACGRVITTVAVKVQYKHDDEMQEVNVKLWKIFLDLSVEVKMHWHMALSSDVYPMGANCVERYWITVG